MRLYKDYFNIDPRYYAAVTADLIEQGKVSWKDFYPHNTFIKLLETLDKVLSNVITKSIWIEGPYGSGKSYAALTVKSILESSPDEVREYFQDYKLNMDLCERIISHKNQNILTVHRSGSSAIETDADLINAVQESIINALNKRGRNNMGESSMKEAFLKWLSSPKNKKYFDDIIKEEENAWDFSGKTSDSIEEQLNNGKPEEIEPLMKKIINVLKNNGITGIIRDSNYMADWIKSVIEKNNFSAVFFVWDEFSNFIENHPTGTTGFQNLIEISQSHPFYFLAVAHKARGLFPNKNDEAFKRIFDRFEIIGIEMPENMAFKLMAQAMKTSEDKELKDEWENEYKPDLNSQLEKTRIEILNRYSSKRGIAKNTLLSDEDMKGVVPLHPYAALVLKFIASVFSSNQRSMFDFIINADSENIKGFKWFINNYGAEGSINLLTVDMLWDFLCSSHISGISNDVESVLNNYYKLDCNNLDKDCQRVVKTVLILKALSMKVGDNDFLEPSKENIGIAYEGVWQTGKSVSIANSLLERKIFFKKALVGDKLVYDVSVISRDALAKFREEAEKQAVTKKFIEEGELAKAAAIPNQVNMRYMSDGNAVDCSSIMAKINALRQKNIPERFNTVIAFAKDKEELEKLDAIITREVNVPDNEIIFIESLEVLGKDMEDKYIDNLAMSLSYSGNNKELAKKYSDDKDEILKKWSNKISAGAFKLYNNDNKGGRYFQNLADLQKALLDFDRRIYYNGPENYLLNDTMHTPYQYRYGAGCGIEQKLSGAFNTGNKKLSFETALEGAWKVERYWEDPQKQSLRIVQIKKKVESVIKEGFESGAGRVSISSIYNELEKPPFGFMPSGACALILGFVLKEYASGEYYWSDGINTETMNPDKMKNMIHEIFNEKYSSNTKYRDSYIVKVTPQVRTFLECTSSIFNISHKSTSVESARDMVRIRMKGFSFPLWCFKYILSEESISTSSDIIENIIDGYISIANKDNGQGDSENTVAEKLGGIFIKNPSACEDIKNLFKDEKSFSGMRNYLLIYRNGILPELAGSIGDSGNYINIVKSRIRTGDSNWVWDSSTVNELIDDIILEYQIIEKSNNILGNNSSYDNVMSAWRSKANNIKLPSEIVEKAVPDIAPLIKKLVEINKYGSLNKESKYPFYDILTTSSESFKNFFNDQKKIFAEEEKLFLSDLSDEEINSLYNKFPPNQFTKDRNEFHNFVDISVKKYKSQRLKQKVLDFWKEKTGTKNPVDWSDEYKTPILCMFGDKERGKAREMFSYINGQNQKEEKYKEVFDYLEKADFYDRLNSQEERDRNFTINVLEKYKILLGETINEVRDVLFEKLPNDRPYDWMDNRAVRGCIRDMADKVYKSVGYGKAMDVTKCMNADELRKYVDDRIKDDMAFGLEILKGAERGI